MNKVKKVIRELRKMCTTIHPDLANRIMYFALMRKKLNIKNPKTFNEKINYLKMNVFPKDPRVAMCADKVAVVDYVRQKVGEEVLVERYNVWDSPEDIDWEKLPDSFAIKCNHGCGYNMICTDKGKLDIDESMKKLRSWIKEDFWKVSCEPHYKQITPKILCERYLGSEICDYKFYCFDGEPLYFYISQTKEGDFHSGKFAMFEKDGTFAKFQRADHTFFKLTPPAPDKLAEMLRISRKLSEDFPFVRVDLFMIDGQILFSELTFTPCSGMMPLKPVEADEWLGKLIDVNKWKV